MFAWQEIIAILRTSAHYYCFPLQQGISVELHTNFKIFRFRGPFIDEATSKDFITKKAVLHVIDGPFFFREAAPALKGTSLPTTRMCGISILLDVSLMSIDFCAKNGLTRPRYRSIPVENGTYTCSVRVGSDSNIFGDMEESYANVNQAIEDTAKKAMNSMCREGLLAVDSIAADKASIVPETYAEPEKGQDAQDDLGSITENGRRISARLKGVTEPPVHTRETPLKNRTAICPNSAADSERLQLNFTHRSRRQVLEQDEGLTLEEINRRVLDEALPQPRDDAHLLSSSRPRFAGPRSYNNNGYESEDELPPSAMVPPYANRQARSKPEIPAPSKQHFSTERVLAPIRDDNRILDRTVPPPPPHKILLPAHFDPVTYRPPQSQHIPAYPIQQTRLLPTGELPYVSPPPFLDTPARPPPSRRGTGAEIRSVWIEDRAVAGENEAVAVGEVEGGEHEDEDEVVYMGERTVGYGYGFGFGCCPEDVRSSSRDGEGLGWRDG